MEPGFYNAEIGVLVNLDTWKKLNERQKAVLTSAARWMEDLNLDNAKLWEEEKKRQTAAGIQPIVFSAAESAAYVKQANDAIWADINRRSPEHGPKLRQLLTR